MLCQCLFPHLDGLPVEANELYLPVFEIRVCFLLDGLPAKANKLHLPVFEIRVFFLLDGQPVKAIGPHLPRFVIRVFLLLVYVGPRCLIPYYLPQPP